jgi:hypothetical protein
LIQLAKSDGLITVEAETKEEIVNLEEEGEQIGEEEVETEEILEEKKVGFLGRQLRGQSI